MLGKTSPFLKKYEELQEQEVKGGFLNGSTLKLVQKVFSNKVVLVQHMFDGDVFLERGSVVSKRKFRFRNESFVVETGVFF